jgi:hypothetical protein
MLLLTGKCLDVTQYEGTGPTGPFTSTTMHILSGIDVLRVRVGRDFPPGEMPKRDEDLSVEVVVSAYKSKDGAATPQITALSRVRSGRVAAAS